MERLPLAVCIIARNEQERLRSCLDSVAPIASQIVLVDTGSTDETAQVASRYGAEVHHFRWCDDFAAARNESLRHVRQPWILVLDADEVLTTPSAAADAIASAPSPIGGFLTRVQSRSTVGDGPPTRYVTQVVRLFRNDERLRYDGIVHEQILPSILHAGFRIAPSSITIEHHGYVHDPPILRRKQERNLRLLDRAIEREPKSAFYRLHRARTLMALGYFDRARTDLEWARCAAQNDGMLLPQILLQHSLLAALEGRDGDALASAQESLRFVPDHPMSWFLIGDIHERRGNVRAALDAYERAMHALEHPSPQITIIGTVEIPLDVLQSRIQRVRGMLKFPMTTAHHESAIIAPSPRISSPTQEDSMQQQPPQQPLLTLAMIVRDEEDVLPTCLRSVRDCADQIVIVDTGSHDRTIAIAEEFGAEVYHFPWCDDFAAARNESLRHASGEWILYLDADEQLDATSAHQLRSLLERQPPQVGGLLCTIVSPHRVGMGGSETHRGAYPRLFRNYGYPRIAFRGRVHEQITPAIIECGGAIVHSPIVIHHRGYDISPEQLEAKVRRNYRLLIQHVQEEPLNAYAWFQLAQTLARMQLFAEAERAFGFALQIGLSAPLAASAASALAYICGVQGRYQDALHWAEESLQKVPDQTLALNYKAHALVALGRYYEAAHAFEELLARLDRHLPLSVGFEIELDRKQIEHQLQQVLKRNSGAILNAG
ncbi:MAG: glycosyltransferase [Chlorobiota bacterium]|nr:MAG: glycosyltransferase [Chlorobiota bacterium]